MAVHALVSEIARLVHTALYPRETLEAVKLPAILSVQVLKQMNPLF